MSYKVNPAIAAKVDKLVSYLPISKKVVTLVGSSDNEKATQADLKELFDAKAKDRKGNMIVVEVKSSTAKEDKK